MDYRKFQKRIKLDASNIDVTYLGIEWFLQRLKSEDPFHFLRVNHATIDKYCWKFVPGLPIPAKNLGGTPTSVANHGQFEELEDYLHLGKYHELYEALMTQDTFGYFVDQKTIAEKLKTFVEVFHGYKDISKKFEIGVSLGVGLDTVWGRYVEHHPLQSARLRVVSLIVEKSKHEYYHSGVLRHFAVMGQLPYFFETINKLGYQVVFLGPAYMKLFEEQYNIENFHHIVTPLRSALDGYGDNLEEVKKIREEKGKTILFHSTGHVAAGWIAYQLKDTDIFGIDIGRSFDWDIAEKAKKDPTLVFPTQWINVPKRKIVNHIKKIRNG